MPDDTSLLTALRTIQVRGAIGEASLEHAIEHAEQFVAALPVLVNRLIDLGSGGGLPGLVIAVRRPEIQVTLVERRQSRADLLSRAVRSLSIGDHVTVVAGDVRSVAESSPSQFQVVTARSFAAPSITARWAGVLLSCGGRLVVSEPPVDRDERWPVSLLEASGLVDQGRHQGVRVFVRS